MISISARLLGIVYRAWSFCTRRILLAAVVLVFWVAAPGVVWACACGCSVFDVGTPSLLPNGAGGTVWFETDFINQYINWHHTEPSSGSANPDKQIKTWFLTAGAQYMFNRKFGAMITVPYTIRTFRTEGDTPNEINQFNHANFGDVRLWGMYTGLQEDMSLGLLAGFKLNTGDHVYSHFDRDTSIGTGSTDLLLGAYKLGSFPTHIGSVPLTFSEKPFQWFAQGQYDYPFHTQGNYVPGKEFDAAMGSYYNFGRIGPLKELAPMLTLYGAFRSHDLGEAANTPNSGYERLLLAPGGEIKIGVIRFYADFEVPVFQHYNGQQLAAPYAIKTIVSYDF
jgi:hypothetical protein